MPFFPSPCWWSTDHEPDPRVFMPFEVFYQHLIHIKGSDFTLYPYPGTPMTILDLDIDGFRIPFLVTARPYHLTETKSQYTYVSLLSEFQTVNQLRWFVEKGGKLDLPFHFFPHIRGLFAGRRGHHFFWYHLGFRKKEYEQQIEDALMARGLSPTIQLYPSGDDNAFYSPLSFYEVQKELQATSGLVHQRLFYPDFPHREVSAEEFIEEWPDDTGELMVYYPIRLSGIKYTLPLAIATRTNRTSRIRHPVVLGVFGRKTINTTRVATGILPIIDRSLAETVSRNISADFGIAVDAVLYTPTPRPKGQSEYERVIG